MKIVFENRNSRDFGNFFLLKKKASNWELSSPVNSKKNQKTNQEMKIFVHYEPESSADGDEEITFTMQVDDCEWKAEIKEKLIPVFFNEHYKKGMNKNNKATMNEFEIQGLDSIKSLKEKDDVFIIRKKRKLEPKPTKKEEIQENNPNNSTPSPKKEQELEKKHKILDKRIIMNSSPKSQNVAADIMSNPESLLQSPEKLVILVTALQRNANECFEKKQYKNAILIYEQLQAIGVDKAGCVRNQALICHNAGAHEKCVKIIEEQLVPEHFPQLHDFLKETYSSIGNGLVLFIF